MSRRGPAGPFWLTAVAVLIIGSLSATLALLPPVTSERVSIGLQAGFTLGLLAVTAQYAWLTRRLVLAQEDVVTPLRQEAELTAVIQLSSIVTKDLRKVVPIVKWFPINKDATTPPPPWPEEAWEAWTQLEEEIESRWALLPRDLLEVAGVAFATQARVLLELARLQVAIFEESINAEEEHRNWSYESLRQHFERNWSDRFSKPPDFGELASGRRALAAEKALTDLYVALHRYIMKKRTPP